MRRSVALALLFGPALAWSAAAQTTGSGANNGPSPQLVMQPLAAETPAYVAPQVEHLLGDLGGVRTDLENRGIYLSGDVANQGRAGTYAPATGAKVAARMAETLQFEKLNVTRSG